MQLRLYSVHKGAHVQSAARVYGVPWCMLPARQQRTMLKNYCKKLLQLCNGHLIHHDRHPTQGLVLFAEFVAGQMHSLRFSFQTVWTTPSEAPKALRLVRLARHSNQDKDRSATLASVGRLGKQL